MIEQNDLDLQRVEPLIRMAFDEDIGSGDATSMSVIPPDAHASGRFVAKADGVVAGLPLLSAVYGAVDKSVTVTPIVSDGDAVCCGTVLATVEGPAIPILTGERVALNFLQRLSGIATLTSRYVAMTLHTKARILDTRKTIPGWRYLEKYAVRKGGGCNHRMGLYDQVLIKDNHLELAGGKAIAEGVARARRSFPALKVEVEVENLAQVMEALAASADIIMLDNMSVEQMAEAVSAIRASGNVVSIEASGGVSLQTVQKIAETGVDWISVGELTHSPRALDISLDLEPAR